MNVVKVGELSIFLDRESTIETLSEVARPLSCRSAKCAGFNGCLPKGVSSALPYGMSVPIPEGWASVPTNLVPDNLPLDFGAAMIRLSATLGRDGHFFSCISRNANPARLSPAEMAEIQVSGGTLKYAGSKWLLRTVSAEGATLSLNGEFRPLVVSGSIGWGTKAVYDGYVSALRLFGIDAGMFEYDVIRKTFMPDIAQKMLLAECVDVRNKYTHLIVIDGLSMQEWLLASCGLKKILVSTEDPYSLDPLSEKHPCYDYVLSNERIVAEGFGLPYLPTAADPSRCRNAIKAAAGRRDIDVCFIGALFPERKEMIKEVYSVCKAEGLKFFAGGTCTDADALEMPYFVRGEFSTDNMLLAQASSKVCINMFRSPFDSVSTKNVVYRAGAESMNPRCYDAPLCGAAMITDGRPEVSEIFGDECIYAGNIAEMIKFLCVGKNAQEMAADQAKKVMQAHTYSHRLSALLCLIEKGMAFV